MLAGCRYGIAGRKFLDHFNIAGEASARENAFQQIMAQHSILGDLILQGGLEAVDLVDALAAIGAFFKQILVHVRDRECVGIEPVGTGKGPLKKRALATHRQRRRHPGLQHGVAARHRAGLRIEDGMVERMRHLADQPRRRSDRQPGVGIQRDHIADC